MTAEELTERLRAQGVAQVNHPLLLRHGGFSPLRKEAEAKMLVLIRYKDEERFKVLEAHSLECTPYPEAGRVVVELNTPTGSVFLEAEGNAEKLVEDILEDLLSEDKYVVQVAVKSVVRERWGE